MEIKIKSKKFKGKFIYAHIAGEKKGGTLVVFMSGFSGSKKFFLFEEASLEFRKNGFATLRLNFCGDEEEYHRDMPNLQDFSFAVYAEELKNVLHTVGKKFKKIVLVGHSFGTPIALMFLKKYKSYALKTQLVVWDPSVLPFHRKLMDKDFTFDAVKKLHTQKGGGDVLVFNSKFYKELSEATNSVEIFKKLNIPACIIGAEKGAGKDVRKYFSKIKDKRFSTLLVIKGADHLFEGKHVQKELFEETLKSLS